MDEAPANRWDRLRDLFLAAAERPEAERERFVRAEAADDALANEVLQLLRVEQSPGRFDGLMERLTDLRDDAVLPSPDHIGPYRILRLLGQGGMGAVYLAERSDGQFEQRVAIKLLRADRAAGSDLVERFLAERQILAQLVHKNIAWLLDGNTTEDGRPYLVMEYVEGQPILDYCNTRDLAIAARLELFGEVCAAVEYAHRRLVVHRDLKPANILVTYDGVVKLLDFGIAKLLDPAFERLATRTGQRIMTPEYASPEQVRGETVGTASDVYQLGLLLYELLTGHRPWDSLAGSLAAIEQAILSTDPVRPSQAVTASPRLTRQLAGDLDHIVLKALRKEPEQRYGSATELFADVRRHLDGHPVLARKGTWRYRSGRFARRHRVGLAASVLLVLSLAAGTAGVTWQAARASAQARIAAAERDRARLEAAKATQLASFLTGLFDGAAEGNVRVDTLRLLSVLDRGAARIQEELRDQPEVQSAALIAVSDVYEKLDRFEEAQRLGEEALRLRRATLGDTHADVAESLDNLGGLRMDQGDVSGAERFWSEAVSIRRALADHAAAAVDSATLAGLASSLHNLAVATWRQRRLDIADSLESEALRRYDAANASRSTNAANSLDVLALIRRDQGRAQESLELMQRALALRRSLLTAPHQLIAVGLNNVATALIDLDRAGEAEPLLRDALAMRRELYGDEHTQVAVGLHNLGAALKALGRDDEAIAYYEEGLAMRRRLLGERHLDVALSLSSIALLHFERERYAEALPLFREAVPIWAAGLNAEHPVVLRTRAYVGGCLSRTGRFADGERELLAVYPLLVRAVGDTHAETQRVRSLLRELYEAWGRPADAARYVARDSS
jgi:serine/threonine-protein kinase